MDNYHPVLADDASVMADQDDNHMGSVGRAQPRRHDDEDEGSDILEDDDLESTVGGPVSHHKGHGNGEEEKELPAHACA
jgi:regulator of nonsense transcripts 1